MSPQMPTFTGIGVAASLFLLVSPMTPTGHSLTRVSERVIWGRVEVVIGLLPRLGVYEGRFRGGPALIPLSPGVAAR